MATLTPPWGHDVEESCWAAASGPRPSTRTEMVRIRREKEASYAEKMMLPTSGRKGGESQMVPPEWWKLVEGYREKPYDDLASSPRFQWYMDKRAKAHTTTECPDPFKTHEVRLRKPSRPRTEKISRAEPPPADAEAYFAAKRTVNNQFTGEYFEWKARLISHGDLDERGKNRRVTLEECMPPYSSLASSFTGCSIDPKNIRSPRQARVGLRVSATLPLDKPSAAEVARKAIKQRRILWKEILAAAAGAPRRKSASGDDFSAGFEGGDGKGGRNSRPSSASTACSKNATGARRCEETQIRPPSAPPESNRRRYSRLCGQG